MRRFFMQSGWLGGMGFLAGMAIAAPAQAFTLSGFTTTGATMSGMEITVNYLNGGSETVLWKTTGAESGGAFGSGWSLSLAGNSYFGAPWLLETDAGFTRAIASLRINAIPGNTVFDIDDNDYKTPGSAQGFPFLLDSGRGPDAFAYLTDIAGAQDDLKGVLTLQWHQGFWGSMGFWADTDNGTANEPVRAVETAPEPTTIAGLALAAAGFAGVRRRRPA